MTIVFQKWVLDVNLKDRGGNPTSRSFDFLEDDPDADPDTLQASATGLITNLLLVTACSLVNYGIKAVYLDDAFVLPTSAEAEAEAHALITAPIHGLPNKSATIDIPGPEIAVFQATSGQGANQVQFDDPGIVTAYLDHFTFGDAVGDFTLSDGEQIDQTNLRGKRTHSRSTKG